MHRALYTGASMMHRHIAYLREKVFERWGKQLLVVFAALAALMIAAVILHAVLFGPPSPDGERRDFVVEPGRTLEEVARSLEDEGYVRYGLVFAFAYSASQEPQEVRPGGYSLSRGMDAWMVAKVLGERPALAWVTIPAGVRKEEIADILTGTLGWTEAQKEEWLAATAAAPETFEGVYFPDTYLIPSDQPPAEVAARLRGRFDEAFAPYVADAAEKGMDWQTVVNLAAIVEKEAAKNDKALVAGILWNRLDRNMLLQVDATLQYIAGTEEDWWPVPDPDDKYVDSPYNTYKVAGLPVHPIANPSIASIEAVIYPEKTACLYYLHDSRGRIHCSTNYKGHVANVNRYLK